MFVDKSGQTEVSKARVFDSSGKMIKEISNFDLHSEIDISQFPTGLYLFQYFRNDVSSGAIRLMKN
ncbi:MAG: T9SS type A sorting domain-containing protein [Bacteroidetes bacterium]|nr:T9SS type A sorting domain-containing protein [Bacteroidota bacterium]